MRNFILIFINLFISLSFVFRVSGQALGKEQEVAAATHQKKGHLERDQFKAFPNPVTDVLSLHFLQSEASTLQFTVYNFIGNAMPLDISIVDERNVLVKVKELPPGYYFLVIQNVDKSVEFVHRFLKI